MRLLLFALWFSCGDNFDQNTLMKRFLSHHKTIVFVSLNQLISKLDKIIFNHILNKTVHSQAEKAQNDSLEEGQLKQKKKVMLSDLRRFSNALRADKQEETEQVFKFFVLDRFFCLFLWLK